MNKPQGAQQAVTTTPTKSQTPLSLLEELLLAVEKPTGIHVYIYHTCFHRANPVDHMLAALPLSSVIVLRAVSKAIKEWVEDYYPDLMYRLRVTCPLPPAAGLWKSPLRRLSQKCVHLAIKVLPSTEHVTSSTSLMPSPAKVLFHMFRGLTSLRIVVPSTDAFEPLLSLRLALESTALKNLTQIHIERLTNPGLLGLRWGGFDALHTSTWIGQSFWRGLKSLRIGMTDDWLEYGHHEPEEEHREPQKSILREEKDIYRQGIQTLHNYLFQFSVQNTLDKFHFDWIDGIEGGPNPLLLDEVIGKEGGGKWFSAPATKWKGLKEVWLGGVKVTGADVKVLKERLEGMEKLMIWENLAAPEICGKVKWIDNKEWLDVDLNADMLDPSELGEFEDLFDSEDEGTRKRVESMVVPFVLRIG
ncbi:MAG: hypothetical protein L6R39_000275 [Caloplaca ligustica]|nr:MAG: hypothetical protein L6R39_000275 [Caloplaca ligustica]